MANTSTYSTINRRRDAGIIETLLAATASDAAARTVPNFLSHNDAFASSGYPWPTATLCSAIAVLSVSVAASP
jgi:hypothetical protein